MSTAVLVVDMQNGFLHPHGSLARAGMGLPGGDAVVRATRSMLDRARATGVPVLFTRHVISEGGPEMSAQWRAAAAPVLAVEPRMLSRGSWDAQVLDDLGPERTEQTVDKDRYDAFLETDLQQRLRDRGVERIVVAGVLTNVCVESTVRAGLERRFRMAVAEDCTAAYPGYHEPSLAAMRALFVTVGGGEQLLA